MFKSFAQSIAGVSILAIGLVGVAHADKAITVEIEYDRALLTSQAGAQDVLESIASQAQRECSSVSLSSGFYRDEACELDVIHKAGKAIGGTELAAAYEGSDVYIEAPVAGVVLASN